MQEIYDNIFKDILFKQPMDNYQIKGLITHGTIIVMSLYGMYLSADFLIKTSPNREKRLERKMLKEGKISLGECNHNIKEFALERYQKYFLK